MCGRFNLVGPARMQYRFGTENDLGALEPRYNIAPGQDVLIITNRKEMELVRWGLVPSWSKEAKFGSKTINARAETITQKPAYEKPFRFQRCLIPATGFYEWMSTVEGKVPHHIRLKSGKVFGFAGLYDTWRDKSGSELRTCTIITTKANDFLNPIHDRMPVIMPEEDEKEWLNPELTDAARLRSLLRSYPSEEMEAYAVSTAVNKVENEGEGVVSPVTSRNLQAVRESPVTGRGSRVAGGIGEGRDEVVQGTLWFGGDRDGMIGTGGLDAKETSG
jgi:putative SOS response-associated peptidase YedK